MASKSKRNRKRDRWLDVQRRDSYTQQARKTGYRARAAYKIEQIDRKFHLFKGVHTVIDLGAAPGSWSQYARNKLSASGQVISIDRLPMAPIDGVYIIEGDFLEDETIAKISDQLQDRQVDLVISDMAPNITGIKDVDQGNFEQIFDQLLGFCDKVLKDDGNLLMKVFAGSSRQLLASRLRQQFKQSNDIKPDASRAQSKEHFVLARGHRRKQAVAVN